MTPPWKGIVNLSFTPDTLQAFVAEIDLSVWKPSFVVVHNTQEPTLGAWHDVPGEQRMRNLEAYYRDTMKWSGGPHLFVADDIIWAFTPLNVPGVHSPSWNGVSWGVETVGDYDKEPLLPSTRGNLIGALRVLHAAAGWTTPQIKLHKDDPLTTHSYCPGKNIVRSDIVAALGEVL